MNLLKIFLLSFLFISCEKSGSPESRLKGYVKFRFEEGHTKEEILSWLADPLRAKYEDLSDQQFKTISDVKGLKLKKFRVVNSNCSNPKACYITYTIKYETSRQNQSVFSTEVKKIAELKQDGDTWKIADVNNIKTFHSSEDEITP